MLRFLLRTFAYLYHLLLCLFLAAVGGLGLLTRHATLNLGMLPWEDPALSYWLFFGGLAGLFSLLLAVTGKLRLPFLIWTAAVAVLAIRGFFLSPYAFRDAGHFTNMALLTVGAVIAVAGAWMHFWQRR
ncbi:MAG: hypothetical protein KIT09_27230 [Bryobacteraceae bacterium]|nr:hypothetical protein [Bryobacteraceae bacterium]